MVISSRNPFTNILNIISSYDGNVLLIALISLLVVILFVLLLHIYARWFLFKANQRRQTSMTVSHVLRPNPTFHHFHSFETTTTTLGSTPKKGLDSSTISSIPLFVYNKKNPSGFGFELECVVCLSVFEENEVGRNLPKCGHCFHVECIDMWLNSHSSCPICRAHVVASDHNIIICGGGGGLEELRLVESVSSDMDDHEVDEDESRLEIVINHDISMNCDRNVVCVGENDSSSMDVSSSFGCSLKRMLSRNGR